VDRKPDINADTAPDFDHLPSKNVKVRCMAGSRKMSLNSGVKSAMKGHTKEEIHAVIRRSLCTSDIH
jgi:hypothetical protein